MNKANVCILNENNWHKCLPWIKAPSSLKCVANASFQRGKNKRWLLFDFFFFSFWLMVVGFWFVWFEVWVVLFFFLVHLFIFVCCFFSSPCSGFRVITQIAGHLSVCFLFADLGAEVQLTRWEKCMQAFSHQGLDAGRRQRRARATAALGPQ